MDAQLGGIETQAPTRPDPAARAPSRAKGTNRLTDRAVRSFLARARAGTAHRRKLSDGGGLYVTTTPAGTGVWRVKYRFAGKERLYSVGTFPEIGLEAARAARDSVKAHLRAGRDPIQARYVRRAESATASGNTFEMVARDWLAKRRRDWSKIHFDKSQRAIERDVLPILGALPVQEITPAMVAAVIESVTRRGVRDTAAKVLWHVICVFRFAQAKGLLGVENPAIPVRELLPKRHTVRRRPALLEIDALRDVLRRAELAALSPSVRLAHRLIAFTAQRIGNVCEAMWSEFSLDGDTPTWTIPRPKMKAKDRQFDHTVLLPSPIAAELRTWRATTGGKGHVFPSPTGNAFISREAIEKVYKVTLGLKGKHSPHGWRASFSTLARDAGFPRDVVELTLDHVHDSAVARAYDRGERLEERWRLMIWWAARLTATTGEPDGKVIPLRPTGTT